MKTLVENARLYGDPMVYFLFFLAAWDVVVGGVWGVQGKWSGWVLILIGVAIFVIQSLILSKRRQHAVWLAAHIAEGERLVAEAHQQYLEADERYKPLWGRLLTEIQEVHDQALEQQRRFPVPPEQEAA